jgi:hypothetical protein
MVADTVQQEFAKVAHQLTELGPPAIIDGTRVQNTMVDFSPPRPQWLAIGVQRAALDANDPDIAQKSDQQLFGPDLSVAATQMQGLTSNHDLASAFNTAPQC